jgi:hypothetical protein
MEPESNPVDMIGLQRVDFPIGCNAKVADATAQRPEQVAVLLRAGREHFTIGGGL